MPPFEATARTLYWFFLYGILGWCVEVIYAALKEHRLVNRGFLCGPICPIYGFGMIALLAFVRHTAAEGDPRDRNGLCGGHGADHPDRTDRRLAAVPHLPHPVVGLFPPEMEPGRVHLPAVFAVVGLGSVVMVRVVHPLLASSGNALPLRVVVVLDTLILAFSWWTWGLRRRQPSD